jgi:aspartate racemase
VTAPRVGIIGGVGPLASAHFYLRLIELAGARRDEDHLPVVVVSERVPSRIAHLAGDGTDPLPVLLSAARTLVRAGVDVIAIPSATTHVYRRRIAAEVWVPVFDLVAETGRALARGGFRAPVFLATRATASLGLYEPHLSGSAKALYPDVAGQAVVDEIIDGVKGGTPVRLLRRRLDGLLSRAPWPAEADVIVLGCTELPVLMGEHEAAGTPVLSVTDVLARAVLSTCATDSPR